MTKDQIAFAWCLDHESPFFCTECKPEYTEEEENAALNEFSAFTSVDSQRRQMLQRRLNLNFFLPSALSLPPLQTANQFRVLILTLSR